MAVCGVERNRIDAFSYEGCDTVHRIRRDADAGCHPEAALAVLAGIRVYLFLYYILIGNESHEASVRIDHRNLLHLVLLEHLHHVAALGLTVAQGDKSFGSHHFLYLDGEIRLEAYVAVRDYSHQHTVGIYDRNAPDMVLGHYPEGVSYCLVLGDGYRIVDHSVLCPLDQTHLGGLGLDGHILVNDTYSTLPCKSDGHCGFSHGIHCSGDNWNVERDVAGKTAFEAHFPRKNFRIRRNQQYVVEGEAFESDSFIDK